MQTINNWKLKFEMPFIVTSKNIKYLSTNLTKYMQDLYSNYKALLRKTKELNKWRANPSLWMGQFNII